MDNVKFYFLRNEPNDNRSSKGQPYGVVAIRLNEDGTVNRGISVCSKYDLFNKNVGKGLALSRLLKAEKLCRSVDVFENYVGDNEDNHVPFIKNIYQYKCCFHEPILDNEHRIYFKPEDK